MQTARSVAILLMLAVLALFMAACASQKPKEQSAARAAPKAAVEKSAAPAASGAPSYHHSIESATPAKKAIPRKKKSRRPASAASADRERHEALRLSRRSVMTASAAVAPSPAELDADTDPAIQAQRIDAYLSNLKSAAYIFNPPSPIKVDEPKTIHLWLDPQATTAELAEELRRSIPQQDAGRIESGQTRWSPVMRATLSAAADDFTIKAIDPAEQAVSSVERTTWSWDITPRHPGKSLQLHLRLEAVMPVSVGPARTITTLDRNITVEVTKWWLFDHYYEKYWKELLAGIGGILVSIGGWWWKNKHASAKASG